MSNNLKFTKNLIDSVSDSFCAAKWYNASIWLSNGRTASCHHPAAHHVSTKEILKDPSALHNTQEKKVARQQMLDGERPDECGYCWKVEDLDNPDIYSDRIYKSMVYNPSDVVDLIASDASVHVDPKNLEICFDNLCNLGCSYCNSEFSSTWGNDINKNGPYEGMKTDGGHTYENNGEHGMPFGSKNTGNFYIKQFFKWFEDSLRDNLQELRVSGGEPTRSPDFWKLVDMCDKEKFNFAINTNLMMNESLLTKLANVSDKFKKFDIYTSCESTGTNAEFVRSGLDYEEWKHNLQEISRLKPEIHTHIMMTVSALSIWTMGEFLSDVIEMRKELQAETGTKRNFHHMSVNILRFPSFQSINVIDGNNKELLANNIRKSLEINKAYMSEMEINNFYRVISYLEQVETGYEDVDSKENKINDLKNFVTQYSERRNLPMTMMPNEFNGWINTL